MGNAAVLEARQATKARAVRRARELRLAARMDALDWQERQEPTCAVRVVIDKTKDACRRRKADDRVWGAMTKEQEQAAELIVTGSLLTGGRIGVPIASYCQRIGRALPCETESRRDWEARVARTFQEWVRECRRNGLSAADVLDYLTKGATMREIDARRQQRKGTAVTAFFEALDLYAEVAPRFKRR